MPRKVNAPYLVPLVRAGVQFQDGVHALAVEAYERQELLREGIAA